MILSMRARLWLGALICVLAFACKRESAEPTDATPADSFPRPRPAIGEIAGIFSHDNDIRMGQNSYAPKVMRDSLQAPTLKTTGG